MYACLFTHRTAALLLKVNFTQNFNKLEYLFLKPTADDSLKSKCLFIGEKTEIQKDGGARNK